MRYADPALCPACRSALPPGIPICPDCQLLVRHPLAVEVFRTLRRADTLIGELRTASDLFHSRTSAPAASPLPPSPPLPPLPLLPPSPPGPPSPPRSGISSASVPKILLGLGSFCLLVAAVVFLAVSWSALGVAGRTAVLGGFTVLAGAAALLLHRIGLRIAGESLIVLALGLVALDVFGARAAGWLGDGEDTGALLVAGLAVAAAGVGLGLLRLGGQPRLLAPQVVSALGLLLGYLGCLEVTDHWLIAGHLFTALVVGLVVLARHLGAPVLAWSQATAGASVWLGGIGIAMGEALAEPDLHRMWIEGAGWSLLVSAAALLLPGLLLAHRETLVLGAGGAAMLATVALALPCLDSDAATLGLVTLAITGAWVLALAVLPERLRAIAIAPSALGSLLLLGLAAITAVAALERWGRIDTAFRRSVEITLSGPPSVTEPLLMVPSLWVALGCLALLTTGRRRQQRGDWLTAAVIVTGLGVAATLASYDVALAAPVAVLSLLALGCALRVLRWTSAGPLQAGCLAGAAVLIGAGASLAAVPSAPLSAIAAGLATAVAVLLAMGGPARAGQRMVGGLTSAPQLTLAVSAAAYTVGGDAGWVAIPVLLALGVLALALARPEVEIPAIAGGVLTFPVSLVATADVGGFTALWLATSGFAFCATALVNEQRRFCAWPGAVLLIAATWVRLVDLEVGEPEAYTLPLAVVLTALGLWRMRRSSAVSSATALLPGLALATVPSLLWVLGDPVSLRALILGGACLALTIAGAALRWSAPLVVGAGVGAAIVLRELGPYASDFPQWVWIGLAGALLTIVGITWERQLLEVRRAVGLVGRLR